MEALAKVEAAEKAWAKAPVHVKAMAGAYMQPVLEALRALAGSSCPISDGAKAMPDGCKGTNCSNGKSNTCTGLGCAGQSSAAPCTESAVSLSKTVGPSAKWPFPGA